jgi:hypothetical protein
MKRLIYVALGLALLAAAALTRSPSYAADKDPTIKEIMTKAHKGGDAILGTLGKDLKADSPDWDKVQKETKDLVDLGTALGKNDPPKGEKDSWMKLTMAYLDTAKDLDAAAGKKDKDTAAADQKKLTGMCMNCHKAHKP